MAQVSNIVKAWVSVFKKENNPTIKKRAAICKECPSKNYKKYLDFINDDLKEVKGFVCTECGCPLIAKIRSEEVCSKWEI